MSGEPSIILQPERVFSINLQVIIDKRKRILFQSIKSRGTERDSTAFKYSTLYKWLIVNLRSLANKGSHFIGDSAYPLKSLLLTPYDNAAHGTAEDNKTFLFIFAHIS